jgi:hypothetical protein
MSFCQIFAQKDGLKTHKSFLKLEDVCISHKNNFFAMQCIEPKYFWCDTMQRRNIDYLLRKIFKKLWNENIFFAIQCVSHENIFHATQYLYQGSRPETWKKNEFFLEGLHIMQK